MSKSFYHYLMKYRDIKKKNELSKFAEEVYKDHSFPKYTSDYHEISSYIEVHEFSLEAISLFDRLWDMYKVDEDI